MKNTFAIVGTVLLAVGMARFASASEPIEIGSRLEPLVDNYLIDQLSGTAQLKLHQPKPREVILVTDKPWEGNTCAYYTVFRDGELFRMYYRGSHYDTKTKKATHPEVTCYAESKDGIHWTKPNLGLFEFDGSKQNNIVWDGIGTHCFTVFKDGNPACPADARYKAISRGRPRGKRGLYVFKSPDGVHWSLMHDEPVITNGAFDSQNLAFWDAHIGMYREYHRTFAGGVRAIMMGTSKDFLHWSEPVLLDYGDAPNEHLYTNAVQPYDRAPHILLGFPTRYLPKEASRVEPVLMTSRDGKNFHRWPTAVVPEGAPEDRSGNRSNYMTWGTGQTSRQPQGAFGLRHRSLLYRPRQPRASLHLSRRRLRFAQCDGEGGRNALQSAQVHWKPVDDQFCHVSGGQHPHRDSNSRRQIDRGVHA